MKSTRALQGVSVILALIMSCIPTQAEWTESVAIKFSLDDKKWHPGWSHQGAQSYVVEFVPEGQTVESWKELITVQFFPGMQTHVSPRQFMNTFLSKLQQQTSHSSAALIGETTQDIVFEWRVVDDPRQDNQWEVDRIIRGQQGLHVLHYVVKISSPSSQLRQKWISFVKAAQIVSR